MTLLEKVRLLGSETPPLVSTLRDECPNDLVRLIQQLLSRDPATRPASAAHVAEALLPFCEGHNLTTLVTRCRERATVEPALDETPVLRPLATEAPPVKPPRRAWLALACLAPLAVCAGIVILLETQKGQLVIESDVAGVKVNVLQDGKVQQQLQVQTGAQSTRLLADKYAIEIDGASNEVVIDQSNVEIRRGATVVARIRQKSKAARMAPDLSHVYDFIGVGDVVEKNKAASLSNLPQDLKIASLEVEAARARLDQQKKEADALKADLAQKTYEYEQVKRLYPQGLISEREYNEKRNSIEQAKSKLQKAEAQVSELAMMLSAKELALESKVNEAEIKNRDSSARASVAAQPMYAGKTLDQWLEVLKDLDTKTRLEALPGIGQLGKNSDKQVLKRINEALTSAINAEAKNYEWSNGNWRRVPRAEAVWSLIGSIAVLNGDDTAFEVLKESCLLVEGKITSDTLVVLYNAFLRGMGDAVCDWLLSENRFRSLDHELAWAAGIRSRTI